MSQIGHFSLKEQAFALLKRIEHDASVNVIDTEHLPPRLYRRRIEQLPIDEQENEQNEGNLQAASENDDNASQSFIQDQEPQNDNNDNIYAQIARLQQNLYIMGLRRSLKLGMNER